MIYVKTKLNSLRILQKQKSSQKTQICSPKSIEYCDIRVSLYNFTITTVIHIQYTNSDKAVCSKTSGCGTEWSLGNAEIFFDWFRFFIADLSYSESYNLVRNYLQN